MPPRRRTGCHGSLSPCPLTAPPNPSGLLSATWLHGVGAPQTLSARTGLTEPGTGAHGDTGDPEDCRDTGCVQGHAGTEDGECTGRPTARLPRAHCEHCPVPGVVCWHFTFSCAGLRTLSLRLWPSSDACTRERHRETGVGGSCGACAQDEGLHSSGRLVAVMTSSPPAHRTPRALAAAVPWPRALDSRRPDHWPWLHALAGRGPGAAQAFGSPLEPRSVLPLRAVPVPRAGHKLPHGQGRCQLFTRPGGSWLGQEGGRAPLIPIWG